MDTSDIAIFKLVSGEEIIANFEQDSKGDWVLSSPRAIRLMPIQTPQGIQHAPFVVNWLVGAPDADVTLPKDKVIVRSVNVEANIIEAYLKNTTGLDISTNAAKLIAP